MSTIEAIHYECGVYLATRDVAQKYMEPTGQTVSDEDDNAFVMLRIARRYLDPSKPAPHHWEIGDQWDALVQYAYTEDQFEKISSVVSRCTTGQVIHLGDITPQASKIVGRSGSIKQNSYFQATESTTTFLQIQTESWLGANQDSCRGISSPHHDTVD